MKKLYLFNTNIIPGSGVVRLQTITLADAKDILAKNPNWISAIGHEGTSEILSKLFGTEVPVNRIMAQPVPGDIAISLKINGRIQEGAILTLEEIESIGYTMYLIEFHSSAARIIPAEISTSGDYYLTHRSTIDTYKRPGLYEMTV